MDVSILTNAGLRLRWQMERLGVPGKIGFGLIIFSAVFFIAAVLPRRAESNALMAKAEAMQAQMKAEPAQPAPARGVADDPEGGPRKPGVAAILRVFSEGGFDPVLDQRSGTVRD